MAIADKTLSFVVSAATGVPAWFTSLADRTWTDIAGGPAYVGSAWQKGATLNSVAPSPLPLGADGQNTGLIRNWDGAASFQTRGEYIKACEGGHAAYYGNEIYALRLKDATPAWKRIWGPTPNASIDTSDFSRNAAYRGNLGAHRNTPRTMHGWFRRLCSEGGASGERIWIVHTGACPSGEWTSDVWSIPRGSLGVGIVDPALWMYHGRAINPLDGSTDGQSGPSAYDPVADHIYTSPAQSLSNTAGRIVLSTAVAAGNQTSAGPLTPGFTGYASAGAAMNDAWSVLTTNTSPRCWIIASITNNNLYVMNAESPGAWRTKTTTGGNVSGTAGAGAVYHAGNRKLILGGINIGTTLRTLSIPTDPWNASSGFTWGTIAPAGGSISAISQFNGTFSQFQMISDMGDGRSCIVMHTRDTSLPTYVYKLPAVF